MKNSCGSLFEGSESMIRLSECRSSNRKAESKRGEIKVMAAFTADIEVIARVWFTEIGRSNRIAHSPNKSPLFCARRQFQATPAPRERG